MGGWEPLIGDYLRGLAAAGRPSTTIGLRRGQLRHMGGELAKPPDRVTGADLLAWFATQGWADETRHSYRSACRGFFGWYAETRGGDNPALALPTVQQPPGVARPVPDQVWADALAKADERVALMLRLAAEAGLRRACIARLHTDDLLDGPCLLVHGKGGRDRIVPISDDLASEVKRRGPGWVFPNGHGGHLTPRYVGELCSAALGAGWTLHQLRHRFATHAYAGSRNIRAVQELLGHSSVATTQRYTAVSDGDLRTAMEAAT